MIIDRFLISQIEKMYGERRRHFRTGSIPELEARRSGKTERVVPVSRGLLTEEWSATGEWNGAR
jgi:hypothetical protein